jgi:cell wall-associated NlpC family hydrolase
VSVSDVASRIQQIQGQLALLSPSTSPASAAAFSSALAGASATSATGMPAAGSRVAGMPLAGTPLAGTPAAGTALATDTGQAVVDEAKKYLGIPYVWGGTNPRTGLDCSGLTQLVYKKFGVELPRVSYQQAREGTAVASLADARPGDLLAFGSPVHHVAIYMGDNKMVHAPRPGKDVKIEEVYETPSAIRRVLPQRTALAAGAVTAAGGAVGSGTPYASLFTSAAAKHGVPATLLAAVAHQESGFNPKAVSPAGARGLMQLMPGTAKGLGVTNPMDPAQAVDGAARLLKSLINEFGRVDLALAAYNAGPGAVHRYQGIPPYGETQRYVPAVLGYQNRLMAA